MKTTVGLTVTFGRDGDAKPLQVSGWSGLEPGHTWAIGTESEVALPPIDAPHGFFLELDCAPYRRQRFEVVVNGGVIGACVLDSTGLYAWQAPPVQGPLSIVFRHPNASRPCDHGPSSDDRFLAVDFRRLRILPLHDRIAPQKLRAAQADCDDRDLVMQFESLGDNCELGQAQRNAGAEPLGLLRFAASRLERVVSGLDRGFAGIADGLEAVDLPGALREWTVHAPEYGIWWHTWIPPEAMTAEALVRQQTTTLQFLAEKLMRDAAEGEKIFVVKGRPSLDRHEVTALFLALRRVGDAPLLWVSADPRRAGEIDPIYPGLLHGFVEALADPADVVGTTVTANWLTIMRNAVGWLRCDRDLA